MTKKPRPSTSEPKVPDMDLWDSITQDVKPLTRRAIAIQGEFFAPTGEIGIVSAGSRDAADSP